MTDESRITQLAQQAESCLDKGDLAQARRLYADICRAQDDDAHPWLMFGAINGELGNVEVAQNALEHAIALDSNNAEAHLVLAHLLRAKGQPVKALASASRAVEVDAKFVEGWLVVAAIAGRLGNWARAEEACNKVIALAPERTEGHVNLGNVLLATGRVPQAEESFRKALALGVSAEAWFGLGTALGAQERHAEAEPALAAALRLDGGNAVFREALAVCLDRLGRTAESMGVRAGPAAK
jgi:tetratricopeptide (TPR) repeat protein